MPKGVYERKEAVTKSKEALDAKETTQEKRSELLKPVAAHPKPVLEPLGPGQKYFESPDGRVLIGEADADRLWDRKGNNGKGMWINPKRS